MTPLSKATSIAGRAPKCRPPFCASSWTTIPAVKKGDLLVELDLAITPPRSPGSGQRASAQGKLSEANGAGHDRPRRDRSGPGRAAVAQANAQNAQGDLDRYLALDAQARSKQQLDECNRRPAIHRGRGSRCQGQNRRRTGPTHRCPDRRPDRPGNLQPPRPPSSRPATTSTTARSTPMPTASLPARTSSPAPMPRSLSPCSPSSNLTSGSSPTSRKRNWPISFPASPPTSGVDAYPGRHITGTVQSVQDGTGSRFTLLPPENATGNYVKVIQRVPVKIELDAHQNDDSDHLLSPGMSVEPSIKVR